MFERSKWIAQRAWGNPPEQDMPPAPYLIRDFSVEEEVRSVIFNVCGLGQAAYYLNGERLPDSVHPTQKSAFTKSIVYNSFDITKLVKLGKNRIGIILGQIWFSDPANIFAMPTPRMIAQLDIEYASGKTESIVSDRSFYAMESPYLFSRRICGERYDANREIPGWCDPSVTPACAHPAVICAGPGGLPRKKLCPPKRVFAQIEGKEIAPGLYDFGENISGWARITLHGKNTEPVGVIYSEWLSEERDHVSHIGLHPVNAAGLHFSDPNEMLHKDVYIPKGEDGESFEPLFSFHGFRYVEITGTQKVSVTAVKAHTDIAPLSVFACASQTLNSIHEYCERSILACCHGAMLDCPQREQNEWTGDGMLTAEVIAMQYDSYGMFYEWMLGFKDEQLPNGHLPSILPLMSNWSYNNLNGLDWSSAIIHIPYYVYKYSGDPAIVETMWENMVRAMDYFETRSDSRLMEFGVGDWVSLDPMCLIEVTDTIYYRIDALMMAELAKALGKDSSRWETLAEEIKREFRAKYVKDGKLTDRCLTALIGSVYSGMLDGDEVHAHLDAAAQTVIDAGYALRCGIHGLRMIFDVLGSHGYNDLIYKVLTNDKVMGYAKCVKDGITTLPEQFNYHSPDTPNGIFPSLNHHFMATVEGWFFRYIAGIGVKGFGWEGLTITPRLTEHMESFRAQLRGICVERKGESMRISSPLPFALELEGYSGHYKAGEYCFKLQNKTAK